MSTWSLEGYQTGGSASGLSITALTTARSDFTALKDSYNAYLDSLRANTSQINQLQGLTQEIKDLEAEQATYTLQAETYDREFQDRLQAGTPIAGASLSNRLGLSTFQDWILLAFAVSYILFFVTLCTYAFMASKKPGVAVATFLAFGLIIGAMLVAYFYRFA